MGYRSYSFRSYNWGLVPSSFDDFEKASLLLDFCGYYLFPLEYNGIGVRDNGMLSPGEVHFKGFNSENLQLFKGGGGLLCCWDAGGGGTNGGVLLKIN